MTRLPVVNAKSVEKILLSLGFEKVRQKGSHVFYRHRDGRVTTLPHHRRRDLARPLLRQILREIEVTPDQFTNELNKL